MQKFIRREVVYVQQCRDLFVVIAQAVCLGLADHLGLLGLAATGICSMLVAAINVIPFMIQRSVPGIGPWVLPAFVFAAIPAVVAYNRYANAVQRLENRYDDFVEEFSNILQRQAHVRGRK